MRQINKKWIIVIAISIFILIAISYNYYSAYLLDKEGRFTIGTITRVEGARGGLMVHIQYSYNGTVYSSNSVDASGKVNKTFIGKRLLLKFIPKQPELTCEYDYDLLIPDSIETAPLNGWSTPPFESSIKL